jgi:murein DD-endopeptidase MepM/ murein hydrolase activator NlpD
VEPPADEIKRIAADAARLNALYKTTTGQSLPGRFEAPVAAAPQNTFGARSIFNGQSRSPHSGVDFPSPLGTPIAAPATATVVLADDLFFTGRTVALDHGLGLISVLAHLSKIAVQVGDAVKSGDVLGEVGATGRALERAPQRRASRPDVADRAPGRRTLIPQTGQGLRTS